MHARSLAKSATAAAVLVLALGTSIATAEAPDETALPLGEHHISTGPEVGSLWSCQTDFSGRTPPAGDWIQGDTWDATAKPIVPGEVEHDGELSIEVDGDDRVITTNGLPSGHTTGEYPIPTDSEAYQYDPQNRSTVGEQDVSITVPAIPTKADAPTCAGGTVGITVSGVILNSGLDAEGVDAVAWHMEDSCHGHPAGTTYHLHSWSPCLEEEEGDAHSELLAYALDGFGVYGIRGKGGDELSSADLDECHGHTHKVEWDGKKRKLYHHHFTDDFPYSVGCFVGTPTQAPHF
jgi:hypothetical protein